MSLNFIYLFFLMNEVVRLVVCQSKKKKKKCKRSLKKNGGLLNCRNMIVLIALFIDFII